MPSIRLGENFTLEVFTINPTDHTVSAGEGKGAGLELEAVNDKGVNIGPVIMRDPNAVDHEPNRMSARSESPLAPGKRQRVVMQYSLLGKAIEPGSYRVRVYRRDMDSGVEVYSNVVVVEIRP